MKARTVLRALSAAVTVGWIAACNYTVGECWYYGEGSENAGVGSGAGPGGGVIVPTGPSGSYEDAPPKDPQDGTKPECNEDETELGEVHCGKLDGIACMMLCAENGVSCPAGIKHNHRAEIGKLYKCCGCRGDQRCWFVYEDGKTCVLRPGRRLVCEV